tara:strand:- start:14306 stop:14944 length:639 start_codon:yes stop_codon:yes gene_type:complete
MNKKAQLLKWIVGIIIGIVLVSFALGFLGKFFGYANQAQQNFDELTSLIIEVNKQDPGKIGQMIYIQDKFAYIYPVNDQSRNFHITKDPLHGEDVDFTLGVTNDCIDQNCYCLCKETITKKNRNCKPGKLTCEPMPDVKFSKGTGIVFDRGHYILGVTTAFSEDQTAPRRQQVKVIKCGNGAPYCKKSNEGDISVIFGFVDDKGVYAQNGVK